MPYNTCYEHNDTSGKCVNILNNKSKSMNIIIIIINNKSLKWLNGDFFYMKSSTHYENDSSTDDNGNIEIIEQMTLKKVDRINTEDSDVMWPWRLLHMTDDKMDDRN